MPANTRAGRPRAAADPLARVLRSVSDPGERRWLRALLTRGSKAKGRAQTKQPVGRKD